tara:strand:+ start:257 stop:793 length:537 start_codon:yes stop_codon:yes gene_type:complete
MVEEEGEKAHDTRTLGNIVKHLESISLHFESKANWLLGMASAILFFTLTNIERLPENKITKIGLTIIIIGCIYSILAFATILVPNIKRNTKEEFHKKANIYSYSSISKNFKTEQQFVKYLDRIGSNLEEISKAHAIAIYWISKKRLPYLSKKLRKGGWALIFSFIIGMSLIAIGSIYL